MRPDLRIIVDDHNTRVYRRGERVTGRVVLAVGNEEEIRALKISFLGICTTTNTQPEPGYAERIQLFHFEQDLLPDCLPVPTKESWTFDFKFPELTDPKYSPRQHRLKYLRNPYPLPPSFQTYMNNGQATISYFLRARLVRTGSAGLLEAHELLPYHPTPEDMQLEPKVHSRVLYAQTWKPPSDGRTAMNKAFAKISRRNSTNSDNPRIIPTLYYPEMISPGQNIPLCLSLKNVQEAVFNEQHTQPQCVLDSVTVIITTHTTTSCAVPSAHLHLQDAMVKHVNCLSKTNMATPVPFDTRIKLATNFRLVDDVECVPSFKTYTITRRYDLTVAIELKYQGRDFPVRCTTLLEILPRIPRHLLPSMPESEEAEIDPLPLYVPREPSREFAPDYESLYSGSHSPASCASLASTESTGSSMVSNMSTPASELDEMRFG